MVQLFLRFLSDREVQLTQESRQTGTVLFAVVMMVFTIAMVLLSNGNIGAAAAPVVLLVGAYALVRLPLRFSVAAFFFVTLLFHNPGTNPMENQWKGPLTLLGPLIYDNLRHITGIGALRFCAIELVSACFLFIIFIRTIAGDNIDKHRTIVAARPMKWAMLVSFAAAVLFIMWGMLRGGDFRQLLWQVRLFLWIPLLTIICMRAFKTVADYKMLAALTITLCVVRCLEGIYFYRFIAQPRGLLLEYMMTHDDTVLLVVGLFLLVSYFLETLSVRAILAGLGFGAIIAFGIYINARRLAYVAFVMCLPSAFFMVSKPIRVLITRIVVYSLPVLLLYVIVGMNSQAAIFGPVHNLFSVVDTEDASNQTRDIENYNLIATAAANPLIGSGFGHEYNEIVVGYSIAEMMSNYRYIAHNSILWLISLTGMVGLTLIWGYMSVAVFLALHAYRRRKTVAERVTAITSIGVVVVYLVMAFGDMGAVSWMSAIILSVAMGCVANLAAQESPRPEQGTNSAAQPEHPESATIS